MLEDVSAGCSLQELSHTSPELIAEAEYSRLAIFVKKYREQKGLATKDTIFVTPDKSMH